MPSSSRQWLSFALFPFKAFVVVALFTYWVQAGDFLSGLPHAEPVMAHLLFFDALILLLAGFNLAFTGPKGSALSAIGFGVAAFFIAAMFLPARA